jgi:predicted HicB family RNase H-like nuclease
MKDILTYKEFIGSVHFDAGDEVFFGKVEGIDDLVSFEGDTVNELKQAFQDSVEDYIASCKKYGKKPEKSYKGSFNVRITPDLHRKVKNAATKMGLSLNQFVQKAMEDEINQLELSM